MTISAFEQMAAPISQPIKNARVKEPETEKYRNLSMEAPKKEKVDMLRVFNSAKSGGHWIPKDDQERDWFLDMMGDKLIEAKSGYFPESPPVAGVIDFYQPPPNGFYDFHVTDKGKKLIDDYDARTTIKGIWKTYHIPILLGIFGILGAIITYYLIHAYFP
jgi:hypothetical protein